MALFEKKSKESYLMLPNRVKRTHEWVARFACNSLVWFRDRICVIYKINFFHRWRFLKKKSEKTYLMLQNGVKRTYKWVAREDGTFWKKKVRGNLPNASKRSKTHSQMSCSLRSQLICSISGPNMRNLLNKLFYRWRYQKINHDTTCAIVQNA